MITNPDKIYTVIIIVVVGIILLEGIALIKGFNGTVLSIVVSTLGGIVGYFFGVKKKDHHKEDHAKRF